MPFPPCTISPKKERMKFINAQKKPWKNKALAAEKRGIACLKSLLPRFYPFLY